MTIELDNGADLMSIFDLIDDDGTVDPVADFVGFSPPGGVPQAGEVGSGDKTRTASNRPADSGLASAATPSVPGATNLSEVSRGGTVSEGPAPEDLSFGQYVQEFKSAFIKARPLSEITLYASSMSFKDYMDFVVKLLPKDVKVQGEVNFTHQLASLGPIDKDSYRLNAPDTVEAEFCEVE